MPWYSTCYVTLTSHFNKQSAINKVHNEIRSLEERRAKLCKGIVSQQWRSISELKIILQTLEPTIIDQQAA
jgi:DNA-directed RNA polymerase subunit F